MFKRYGKNPFQNEGNNPSFEEKPAPKRVEGQSSPPPRVFESPTRVQVTPPPPRPFPTAAPVQDRPLVKQAPEVWKENLTKVPIQRPMADGTPETTLGKGVSFKGTLNFNVLLRIDGDFEGELVSPGGKLVVGPGGMVRSKEIQLGGALIEGKIVCEQLVVKGKLELRGEASIKGDILVEGTLSVDEGAKLDGHVVVSIPDEDPSTSTTEEGEEGN